MTACPRCSYNPAAIIAGSWEFHIGRPVKSGNDRIHNVGASRWSYKADRDAWHSDIHAMRRVLDIPPAHTLRRVTLTRLIGKGQRRYDRDNMATGCKPIVDALVRVGLLIDDDAKHAEIHYAQEKGALPGLRVLLEELA